MCNDRYTAIAAIDKLFKLFDIVHCTLPRVFILYCAIIRENCEHKSPNFDVANLLCGFGFNIGLLNSLQ
jgi:hypothetical protein